MRKVKNTIPVVDICSLQSKDHLNSELIAEPFGSYLLKHPNLHLPHRHSFYHIVLFTKGAGSHSIDFQQFEVAPGDIYFMKPGQVHSWSFDGETDGYVINFSEQLFHNFLFDPHYPEQFPFLQGIAEECVISLPPTVYKDARMLIENITLENETAGIQKNDLIRSYLVQLFITINRSISGNISSSAKPHNQVLLHNFRKLVDAYYAEKRLPKEYATMLYITPNHLNALCNDLIGKSAGEVIRSRILLEAKRLLINLDTSISEIAATLDFTDSSHFTRFFKKHTNVTPDEFRKNASANTKNKKL